MVLRVLRLQIAELAVDRQLLRMLVAAGKLRAACGPAACRCRQPLVVGRQANAAGANFRVSKNQEAGVFATCRPQRRVHQ